MSLVEINTATKGVQDGNEKDEELVDIKELQ